ncbi:MAG: hypothetical protein ACJ790_06715 [Myxococcaceae bacterium]
MPTWLKIVLGILVGSVVICGGVVGGCFLYGKHKFNEMKEGADSTEFAKNNTQDQCLPEALKKVKACEPTGVMCIGQTTFWTASCFQEAQPSPGFCDTVPLNGPAAEAWQQQQCKSVGLPADKKGNDARCGAILTMVFQHCVTARYDGGSGMDNNNNNNDQDQGAPDNDDQPSDDKGEGADQKK